MQWFINALCTLFELIFNNVLSPILTEILTIYVNYYTNVCLLQSVHWLILSEVFSMFLQVYLRFITKPKEKQLQGPFPCWMYFLRWKALP